MTGCSCGLINICVAHSLLSYPAMKACDDRTQLQRAAHSYPMLQKVLLASKQKSSKMSLVHRGPPFLSRSVPGLITAAATNHKAENKLLRDQIAMLEPEDPAADHHRHQLRLDSLKIYQSASPSFRMFNLNKFQTLFHIKMLINHCISKLNSVSRPNLANSTDAPPYAGPDDPFPAHKAEPLFLPSPTPSDDGEHDSGTEKISVHPSTSQSSIKYSRSQWEEKTRKQRRTSTDGQRRRGDGLASALSHTRIRCKPERQTASATCSSRRPQKRPQAVCVSRLADWTSSLLAFEHLVYTGRQGPGEVGRLKGLLREMIKFAEVVPQKWVLEKVRTRAANGVEERRLRAELVEVVFNGYKAYETEGQLADFSAALLGMWMERLLNVQSDR
ncbi:hypothetical protein B0H13DRAFT_1859676 [Mycena leptocephala]|nr:hypothetical protein B0H13DRAFT_1859676 [Mycena leptocephala]